MHYSFANSCRYTTRDVPDGKRIPFGWNAVSVDRSDENEMIKLFWDSANATDKGSSRLRVTVALDTREIFLLEIVLLKSCGVIGQLDIRFASALQPFEILLNAEETAAAIKEGIGLRMIKGTQPLWIFYDQNEDLRKDAPLLLPHLCFGDSRDAGKELPARLASLSSIQSFGWLEGCVMDGLFDLERSRKSGAYYTAIDRHLAMFFNDRGELVYENPHSEPADGQLYGIEATLPIVALAHRNPEHPFIQAAISFWMAHTSVNGSISDGDTLTAEGNYTVAYPLAILAKIYNRKDLAHLAKAQLTARRDRLNVGDELFLRCSIDGMRSFRHWSRAHAWYLLGLIRTLEILKELKTENLTDLENEFKRAVSSILKWQLPNYLWSVYVDEPETGVETSGSAGIATALVLGVKAGLLDKPSILINARRILLELNKHLTPDGVLSGVSQHNKGGEELQRSGYRVISPMGTGLIAQLMGNLELIDRIT